jgi:PPM family protein phosphatase
LERGGGDNTTGIVCGGGATHQLGDALAAERRISVLKHIPIFAHLTYNELVKVVGLTQLMRVGSGDAFMVEGEQGEEFYVVLAGEVEVQKGG